MVFSITLVFNILLSNQIQLLLNWNWHNLVKKFCWDIIGLLMIILTNIGKLLGKHVLTKAKYPNLFPTIDYAICMVYHKSAKEHKPN